MIKQLVQHRVQVFASLLLLLAMCCTIRSTAQGTTEEFGQNRVQYKTFTWSFFESDHFVTYFYLGGQDLGKYTTIYAEKIVENMEKEMEYHMTKRLQIMVYNNLSDLNQTNIGIGNEENNTGGTTKIIQNKLFIYFDGNHQHLEQQIRQGIAQVMINHMLFGSSFQDVIQNAVLLNLPEWYTKGLASYIGENWNADMEDQLRDGIISGKYKKLNKLKGDEVRFVGHAIWHYIEEKYGKGAVSNLLYLTRINRSVESGFLFVLGGTVKSVVQEWYNTQLARFSEQVSQRQLPIDSNKVKKRPYPLREQYQVKLDGDGKQIAYATNVLGKYRTYLLNNETHKQKRILKGGIKTTTLVTNLQYPLLAWSPDKKTLAVLYMKHDQLKLLLYDSDKKKKKKVNITKFQQVHDFRFTNDPNVLVMSGINKGQSDIYTYHIDNYTTEQLTDDFYDDLNAAYVDVDGRKGILFSSNRPTTELKNERLDTNMLKSKFDIYFYDLVHRKKELTRVTNTEFTNERDPLQYDSLNISYISDQNGIANRYVGRFEATVVGHDTTVFFKDSIAMNPKWSLDSLKRQPNNHIDSVHITDKVIDVVRPFAITNNAKAIIENDINVKARKSLTLYRDKGRYLFYVDTLLTNPVESAFTVPENTPYQANFLKVKLKDKAAKIPKKDEAVVAPRADNVTLGQADTTNPPVKKNYFYQSDFNTAPEINVAHSVGGISDAEAPAPVFQVTRVLPYRVKFATDFITTQVDNSLIINKYQPFAPGAVGYNNPDLSALIKLGMSDLFEDHKVFGGFRLPFSFQGSEYFIAYENLKRRLDWRFLYYRKVDQQTYGNGDVLPYYNQQPPSTRPDLPIYSKERLNFFELRLKYPFDVTKSLRAYVAYRNDNYVYQANEAFTLGLPNYAQNWMEFKLEYVVDNSIKVATNLYNGLKFKLWGEFHQHFTIQTDTLLNSLNVPLPNFDKQYFGVVAFDLRYSQKLHRSLTWANRLAAGTSFGPSKVLYYLGGVDGWIGSKFNTETPINQNNGYAYQTLATNVRGFDQNIRNGNSYAVINSEIRWPIFSYLINSNIKSQFLRDFMIIGFTDIGTAWEGLNPYNNQNPLFTDHIGTGSVQVNVQYFRNPIVVGYGFGVRTTLLGYYMRLDVAWGHDSGVTSGPKLYFSLSKDF